MKRNALLFISLVMVLSLSLVISATAQETTDNVVDVIAKDDNLDSFHEAVVAAEMADRLALAGNTFTIFAPRDSAFAALNATSPGYLDTLLAEPEGDLTSIVDYHIVPGNYSSEAALEARTLTNEQGGTLTISTRDGVTYVNNAAIVTADIPAKNGVVHIIDTVLLPSTVTVPEPEEVVPDEDAEVAEDVEVAEDDSAADTDATESEPVEPETSDLNTIADTLDEAGNFTQLLNALEATGLAGAFAQPGNYTLFAPTDDAFEAFGLNTTADELRALLLFHIVGDTLTRDQLATDSIVPTLEGRPLLINRSGSTILDIHGAHVEMFDVEASNGIIHVIDRVIIP